jgi:hypothetical protein
MLRNQALVSLNGVRKILTVRGLAGCLTSGATLTPFQVTCLAEDLRRKNEERTGLTGIAATGCLDLDILLPDAMQS